MPLRQADGYYGYMALWVDGLPSLNSHETIYPFSAFNGHDTPSNPAERG